MEDATLSLKLAIDDCADQACLPEPDDRPDTNSAEPAQPTLPEQRAAPRFTLLVRAVKLVSAQGEFVCVLRDVSETGASVRLFHELPPEERLELHMPGGAVHAVEPVWQRELEVAPGASGPLREAGLRFTEPVEIARLVHEASEFPKRGLRLGVCFPVRLASLTQRGEGLVMNLSQQGARIECEALFAIDQGLRVEAVEPLREFTEVRAKVRWRRGSEYGVVFDDTFTLADFARLAARLQAPGLLGE